MTAKEGKALSDKKAISDFVDSFVKEYTTGPFALGREDMLSFPEFRHFLEAFERNYEPILGSNKQLEEAFQAGKDSVSWDGAGGLDYEYTDLADWQRSREGK